MQTRSSFRNVQSRKSHLKWNFRVKIPTSVFAYNSALRRKIVLCTLAMERSTGAVARLSDAVEGEAGPVLATTQAVTPRIRCR